MSYHHHLRRQHGIVTREQLEGASLSRHQIDGLIRRGELIVVHRGVYRAAGSPATWRSRAAAATIADPAVASHRCAAVLWGLQVFRRTAIEITVPHWRRPPALSGVTSYRTTRWATVEPVERHGIPTTGIDRTLLDCAAVVSVDVLERLVESAIRQELTSWKRLDVALEAHAARGRPGVTRLRRMLEVREATPQVPRSDFSRLVASLLIRQGLEPPRLEFPIHDDEGRLLLLTDLAWPKRRCAVELDGLEHHFGRREREHDIERRAEVRAAGWRVLELSWRLYADSPDRLVDLVARFLVKPVG